MAESTHVPAYRTDSLSSLRHTADGGMPGESQFIAEATASRFFTNIFEKIFAQTKINQ